MIEAINNEVKTFGFTLDDLIDSRKNRLVYNSKWIYKYVQENGATDFRKRGELF